MLSLSRRPGEAVQITVPASAAGTIVTVMLYRLAGGQAVLAFGAPPDVTILRTELLEREGE